MDSTLEDFGRAHIRDMLQEFIIFACVQALLHTFLKSMTPKRSRAFSAFM